MLISVSLAALISLKLVGGGVVSCDHQGTLPCDVILVACQVIIRHLDSDAGCECCVIVAGGLWLWANLWESVEFHMVEKNRKSFLFLYLYTANQPHSKVCIHSYLFPFPVSHQTHNATEYDSAISKQLIMRRTCSSVIQQLRRDRITLLSSSLQRLLEHLYAGWGGCCVARWLRHHLRCSVHQPLFV